MAVESMFKRIASLFFPLTIFIFFTRCFLPVQEVANINGLKQKPDEIVLENI